LRSIGTTIDLASRDRRHFVHAKLIGLTAIALVLQVAGIHGWIRELLVLFVFTFAPGAAVLSLLPRLNPLMWFGISAAFSLLIVLVPAYLMVLISATLGPYASKGAKRLAASAYARPNASLNRQIFQSTQEPHSHLRRAVPAISSGPAGQQSARHVLTAGL
jgi:hypothetical protein